MAIDNDATTELSVSDAGEAFLARFMPPEGDEDHRRKDGAPDTKEAGDTERTPKSPEADDEPSDDNRPEGNTDGDETEETAEPKKKNYVEDDESFIKVKVGETEHEIPVKDLKRLAGQEVALTRKSQEVAEARKKADGEAAKALAALDVMLKRAKEKADPYRQIDLIQAAKTLNDEELNILRSEAQRAFEEESFLQTELTGFMQEVQNRQQVARTELAKASITELTDPTSTNYVDGWSQKVYDDVRKFAIGAGVPKEVANNVIEAPILKLLHMAFLYDKGTKAKLQVTRKGGKPTKVVKTSTSVAATRAAQSNTAAKALDKLRNSGSQDDAAAAFLARMRTDD